MNTDPRRLAHRLATVTGILMVIQSTTGIVWGGDDRIGLSAFFVVGSLLSLIALLKRMREPGSTSG